MGNINIAPKSYWVETASDKSLKEIIKDAEDEQ